MKTKYTNDELAKLQVEKEIAMKTAGVDRFHFNNDRSIKEGSASDTQWNRRIIQELVNPMAEAIDIYLEYYKGRRGKPSKTLTYLSCLPSQQAAYITIKNILDSLTRETEVRAVAKTIGTRIEDQVRFAGVEDEAPRYIEKVQKALRQANSKQYRHQQAVLANAERSLASGNPDKGIDPKPELTWHNWPEQDVVQMGSQLITIFAENVLFNDGPVIQKRVVINGKHNQSFLAPTDNMTGWIEEYKEVMEVMAPAFAPCVIPPRDWKSPLSGGYHIQEIAETLPLIKCRKSQRKRLTIKQMPEVYEAINNLQAVKWQISDKTYDIANQALRLGLSLGIPAKEPYIIPEPPVAPEYDELRGQDLKNAMSEDEWKSFVAWKREATTMHTLENLRRADFMKVVSIMGSAAQYREFENIHFVYTMDFRGRVYCKSDSVSPQGNDLQKGLIRFADGMALGDTGYKWLAVQGANVWGEDKISFTDRVKFIEDMKETIRDIAADPITFTEWAAADKPWQFLNWCFEWSDLLDHLEAGKPASTFISHIPVAMDGSCSGIQHYSAILRDPIGGAAVNLVPDTMPHDIYRDVAEVAEVRFESLSQEAHEDNTAEVANGWLSIQGGIDRGLTKSPVMTLPYGSTQIRCLDTTGQYLTDLQIKENKKAKAQNRPAMAVHPFSNRIGEGIHRFEAEKLGSKVIWSSIGEVVVAARIGMKFIQEVAKEVAKTGNHLEWITPTGFIVEQKEMDYTSRRVKTQLLGATFMTLKEELTTFNVRKMRSSSAPNFIHSMDASHLIKAVNAFKKAGLNSIAVIHDSFGSYAAQTETLRTCLLDTFVDMYQENDVLADYKYHNEALVLQEIETELPEQMGLDLEVIRGSEYCFG